MSLGAQSLPVLEESERRFRAFVLATSDLILITDRAGRIRGRLSLWQSYTGQSHDELLDYGWLEAIHPEDRTPLRDAFECADDASLPFERELRIRAADGTMRCFAFKAVPVKGPDGRLAEWIGSANDIQERRELDRRFVQAQRLEAVSQLAGGVAHDFNNILTSVLGFSQFLLEQLPSDSPYRSDAEEIYRAGEVAAALTRKLLAFSRRQAGHPQLLDLNQAIQDACQVLPRLLGEGIKLDLSARARPALVKADPGQLEQVVLNLAFNARDAMPQGGRLTVQTSATELGAGLLHSGGVIPSGRYVVLSVIDEGIGMPPEVLSRIFEPFYTTKGGTRGTGLGLSTVYGIVQQLAGHLVVQSAPGRGSSFELYLPLVEAASETVMVNRPLGAAWGNEVILFVEDQPAIRSLAQRSLSRAGYLAITAESGEAARALARRTTRIHLIVMDIGLPGERGPAVVRDLLNLHPDARVIYISGNPGMREADTAENFQGFLQKPFSQEQLLSAVRAALDAPVPSSVAPEGPPA